MFLSRDSSWDTFFLFFLTCFKIFGVGSGTFFWVRIRNSEKVSAGSRGNHSGYLNFWKAKFLIFSVVSESGESLLLTAGEVHLQRCVRDLVESYAHCEVSVSDPIVPFRETIVPPPQTDMVNEAIEEENRPVKQQLQQQFKPEEVDSLAAELETPNKQCRFVIRSVPLPPEFTKLLENSQHLLKALTSSAELTSRTLQEISELRTSLEASADQDEQLSGCVERILSFGPKRVGPNILVNNVPGLLQLTTAWCQEQRSKVRGGDGRPDYLSSLVNGFQLATLAGPLCEEPMMGVAFFIEDWSLRHSCGSKNTLHLDLDTGFWPNLDSDPGLCYQL